MLTVSILLFLSWLFFLFVWKRCGKWGKEKKRILDVLNEKTVDSAVDVVRKIIVSKQQLETTFDALSDPLCVVASNNTVVRVNRKYAREAQLPINENPGRKCHELLFKRPTECPNCPVKEVFKNGKPVRKRQMTCDHGGDPRYYEIDSYPVYDEHGEIIHAVEHFHDITEEKYLNDNLARSDRLASIGIMTAGIAHEMNNPLSGLSGIAVNMLKMPHKYGINEKGQERISTILECVARATAIISDLLRFSQKQEIVRVQSDIGEIAHKAVEGVKKYSLSQIQIEYAFENDLPGVRCDPARIEQVLVQILSNAVDSVNQKRKNAERENLPFDGKITIRANRRHKEMCVAVHDNGLGIDSEIETKIFEPFFTTRPPGKGTGLGLSICHRIIEEHQGHIGASTQNGLTTVRFCIPIGKDPITSPEARIITRRKRSAHA